MLSLVTQPDGSARRFPFVTWILLAAMALVLFQQWDEMSTASAEAQQLHEEALAYFHKNPFVQADPYFTAQVGSDLVEGVRAEFYSSRERLGIAAVPDRIQARTQKRFDGFVEAARTRQTQIPAQRFGISSESTEPGSFFSHAFVHGSLAAFLLSAVVILLLGTVLEDVWGGFVFAGFAAVSVLATGFVAVHLGSGPWYGSCGVAGALLGAALIRQFSEGSPRLLGGIPLPAWLLAGLWLASELGLTHVLGPDALVVHAPALHVAALGVGAALGLGVRAAGLEEVLATRWDEGESVNPVYDKAMELREKGKLEEAQRILFAENARKPRDRDIAMALWDVCRDKSEPERAAPMALMLIQEHLRGGAIEAAVKQWSEVTDQLPGPQLKASGILAARMADALFAANDGDRALEALRIAVASEQRMPAAMAVKVVRLALPLDAALARQAAAIAFADPSLDASERAELTELVGDEEASGSAMSAGRARGAEPESEPEPADALTAMRESRSQSSRRVAPPAEALATWQLDSDDVDSDALDPNALDLEGMNEADPADAAVPSADGSFNFDPNALDPAALDSDALASDGLDPGATDSGEIDPGFPDSDEIDSEALDLDDRDLASDVDFVAGDDLPANRSTQPATDGDFDPSALSADKLGAEAVPGSLQTQGAIERSLATETTEEPDKGDVGSEGGDAAGVIWPESEADVETIPDLDPSQYGEYGDVAAPDAPVDAPTTPLIIDSSSHRTVTQVTATPLQLGPQGLLIQVADGRKLTIDWNRVDAIAVAAVADLGAKPVLLIDLTLNWSEASAESLRLIRMRSDRFDPRVLTRVDEPVKALRALSQLLADASGGVPLPDANAVAGRPFAVFDTLARYEREVLLGVRSSR